MSCRTNNLSARVGRVVFSAQFVFLLSIGGLYGADGQPVEKVGFICETDFRSVIQSNEVLLVAGVDVIKAVNGKTYLLALGTAINQAKESPEARAKLDTR